MKNTNTQVALLKFSWPSAKRTGLFGYLSYARLQSRGARGGHRLGRRGIPPIGCPYGRWARGAHRWLTVGSTAARRRVSCTLYDMGGAEKILKIYNILKSMPYIRCKRGCDCRVLLFLIKQLIRLLWISQFDWHHEPGWAPCCPTGGYTNKKRGKTGWPDEVESCRAATETR